MKESIAIHPYTPGTPIPYDLLLLADPSRELIDLYIASGQLYLAKDNNEIIGCYVLFPWDSETTEIKNIAVHEKFQNQGIGGQLLKDAILKAKNKFYKKLVIGTGNSSTGQLYLYQKYGFRITDIKKNFFKDNYPEPIWENGIECTDMILLTMEL
ncbi:GNAT family N-acetyltransferase [Elizabethkingia sp. HvH-WGS333]|uniref:GNAT family N-acetyltransferase n=1 Tax=Elizabethkingia TaxID=308865 RepID=UPI0007417844|nr:MULTISPECIES: GNAT family N-acetyltransferase [Elizabethkingia]KUG12958.1 acetyltransferase [Elizabethkingia miricola]MCL1655505.1 GNAT family N-acetyltransferase [Elizabethkingia miricola]MDX8568961.1 GNAT family N-acetyltransferase [Elizabethkingia sp. HX XZB]MDX8570481.1 GNAT family N-acetyltransferase [Elizabethkingia sp. HX QKY]OIK44662.1 GNAT family N-acetyltransferase [Elizabethkingia sp. HvH-WGS333]